MSSLLSPASCQSARAPNRSHDLFWLVCAALVAFTLATAPRFASANTFEDSLAGLFERALKQRAAAIEVLAESQDPRKVELLTGILAGRVYYRKSDKLLVYISTSDSSLLNIQSVLDGKQLGLVEKRSLKKIAINNRIRKTIGLSLAKESLQSSDAQTRMEAVKSLSKSLNKATTELLREMLKTERDNSIRELLTLTTAVADARAKDPSIAIAAIKILGDSTLGAARIQLQALADEPAGSLSPAIKREVSAALAAVQLRVSLYGWVEKLFFGLSLGSVLALAAVGLAITFGVMGVINMAHGELMMLGAYTTYVVQQAMPNYIDISLLVAIPAAFVVAALFGIAIERGIIRFLYGRPLETLLATFGVSLVLQQMVRSIFTPLNRAVQTPDWMSGSYEFNALLSLTYNRMYIIAFTILVFVVLMAVMKRTPLGLQVRAVAQNRAMARAIGVRSGRVDMLTFALGSGIAGIAGVALSQLTNVGPNLGQAYIVDSFLVVVFGGVGNLWGTLVSGLTLGVANKFMEPWAGAVLAKIMVLVFIIIFIQRRPRGLFPQKGRAAEG